MRTKKAILNTSIAMVEELISVISSLILPRLILSTFGSSYNGITSSITQFLSCAVLMRAGIGGAARAALYRPLANGNKKEIDSIMKATENFMKKVAAILGISIIVFAIIYPTIINSDFEWFFSFSLVLIIGISTFAESLFGITYQILLQADQRQYIISIIKIISVIINTILATILIKCNMSIHIVKLGSSVVFALNPIVLSWYVRKRYSIDRTVKPNNELIGQRWDAFYHQVATFVTSNTDIMVLTVFSNIREVSVYTVYSFVTVGLKKIIINVTNGLEAAFGSMIAKEENSILEKNISIVEYIVFTISTIIFTSASLLITQFVMIYTKGITDVNYNRPVFAYVILLAEFFNCIRLPYQLAVQAAGHYKQTKKGAVIEAILNITISIVLVNYIGLVGVAIGTLCATIFRTVQYSVYMSKYIINKSIWSTLRNCLMSLANAIFIIIVANLLNINNAETYFELILNSIVMLSISIISSAGIALLFYREIWNNILISFKSLIKKPCRS